MEKILDKLKSSLSIYWHATGVGVLLLDKRGREIALFGNPNDYCDLIRQEPELLEKCLKLHREAGPESARLGECYFFGCHAGMIHFGIAIMENGNYTGCVLAGPLLVEYPTMSAVDNVIEKCNLPAGCRPIFLSAMKNIQLVDPQRLYYLGELLYQLVSNMMSSDDMRLLRQQRNRQRQQELIGLAIQDLKSAGGSGQMQEIPENVHLRQSQKEEKLSEQIEEGNLEKAQETLNDILGEIYFSSGNNLELIKLRMNELVTVLSRRAMQQGADSEEAYQMTEEFQRSSAGIKDLEELSYQLSLLIPRLVSMIEDGINENTAGPIRKSLEFIRKNYRYPISLEDAAEQASMSTSHFSRAFKAEMGVGFSVYVNQLRIKKAMNLLKDSDMSLSEVSQSVGYSNQQYFSRVFKTETGKTPGQYRKLKRQGTAD